MTKADMAELKNQVQFLDLLKVNEHELYQERLVDFHKIVSRISNKNDLQDRDISEVNSKSRALKSILRYPINENKDLYVRMLENYNDFIYDKIKNWSLIN